MSYKLSLFPFKIERVIEDIKEIPEGVKMIRAPEVWDTGQKGLGVVIAVIDTGCQKEHPDLRDNIISGKNFSNDGNDDDYSDNIGHGTHVAGTIAAVINGDGVIGVAPEASLLILKVFDVDGYAKNENVIKAIDHAIAYTGPNQEKVRIINLSFGSSQDDPRLHEAVKRAVNANILVVCAAGNEGDNDRSTIEIGYPAAYSESVCVGAVDLNKKITSFTNTNDEVDLVAPGQGILSTFPVGIEDNNPDSKPGYAILSGTSMATPHVSGAVAIIINQSEQDFKRILTEDEIYAQLVKRTVSLGYSKQEEGNGLLILTE
ncbi:S8 family peptidase [Bacillus sp. 123MFChir2]|uniref:S8 family peptidase n=1 Tax=Bacillus sp. 123MFChir2 TaxID=1169144 RepID=UPI00037540D1|nr:S8 family peptidase [Bacillus sp. 123MFChir2]